MLVVMRISVALSLLAGAAISQNTVASQTQNSASHTALYRHAAREMAKSNPAVSSVTLEQDLLVVGDVEPKIRAHYPNTFSDEDIQHITIRTWVELRGLKTDGPLDMAKFERYAVQSFGGLQITSQPNGAMIEVDEKPWSDTTDARSSCRVGTRHIKLSKDGYEDAVGDAVVKEGQWTLFDKTLRKK